MRQVILICSGSCNQNLCGQIVSSSSFLSTTNESVTHEWTYFQAKHSMLLNHLIFRQINNSQEGKEELQEEVVIRDALVDIFQYSQDNSHLQGIIPLMVGYIRQDSVTSTTTSSKVYDIISNQDSLGNEYSIPIGNNLKVDTFLLSLSISEKDILNETTSHILMKLDTTK